MALRQDDMGLMDVTILDGNLSTGLEEDTMISGMDFSTDMLNDTIQDAVFDSIEPTSNTVPETDLPSMGSAEMKDDDGNNAVDPRETPAQVPISMSGPGAGPLPTNFHDPASNPPHSGSTLTEFTKRRNWSQRVLEELKDFLYILTPDGRVLYVSPSAPTLTGYTSSELVGKFMIDFIHNDDSSLFIREFNESIATGHPTRFYYRFRLKSSADSSAANANISAINQAQPTPPESYIIFETHGHPHLSSDQAAVFAAAAHAKHAGQDPGPLPSPATFCRGYFMMARPYPTKNASLLDSFLEHKIESERLRRRIAELKKEEDDDAEQQAKRWARRTHQKLPNGTAGSDLGVTPSLTPSESMLTDNTNAMDSTNPPSLLNKESSGEMPPPPKPSSPRASGAQLTQQALESANAISRAEGITDKMARYRSQPQTQTQGQGSTDHLSDIDLLTGLQYSQGERSVGISTGGKSPTLVRGDAGIVIPADKQHQQNAAASGPGAGVFFGTNTQGQPSTGTAYAQGSALDKKKKAKAADEYVCTDCGTLDSPEWRKGPQGPKTLCNACGLRWAKKEKKKSSNSGKGGGGGGESTAGSQHTQSTAVPPVTGGQVPTMSAVASGAQGGQQSIAPSQIMGPGPGAGAGTGVGFSTNVTNPYGMGTMQPFQQ